MVSSEAGAIGAMPLLVKVLFMTCVGMLVANTLFLILTLELTQSSVAARDDQPGQHQGNWLQSFVANAASAEPEFPLPAPPTVQGSRVEHPEGVATALPGSPEPQRDGPLRTAALLGLLVNAAAIAVLIVFYLLMRGSFARQAGMEAALMLHNRSLETTIAERTRDLSELSAHLIRVAEEEKARLARDLHDELGSSLTAIKLEVAYVAGKLKESASPLADRLQRAIDTLRGAFQLKRRLVEDLWPTMLEHLGLAAALRAHCSEFTLRTGIPCVVDIAEELDLESGPSIALYRVAQESLTNIAKYAQASNVTLIVKQRRGEVTLEIGDNGIGIPEHAATQSRSYGLVGMRERISQLGGSFAISRRPGGRGTLVEALIPLAVSAPARMQAQDGTYG